ncbi:glycosyltransferase [Hyphomicrobium sp. MC1]|uniref:glycosyltransferase family 2 protein n=1 Tax=Hyphomicrobium sp. (strain MC1) TaxID=717785 RepID=UPI000213D824|nr:glycosyltransferase [Hyphomicrobium sp. MC1]CCB65054.1 protein of unknown function [Hyphomicrobium sp. MC1]
MTEQAELTIALPVYNGERFLDEALANSLADRLIKVCVVVYDNASTDRSAEIATAWSEKDSRVRLVKRPANIGALRNFADAVAQAETPYFAWRAYDDLSSPGYFETLIDGLKAAPGAILAIPNCRTVKPNREDRITSIAAGTVPSDKAISDAHPAWLYGVWRTHFAQEAAAWTSANAPSLWGWDHLALLHAALAGTFIGCPQAIFIRRLTKGPEKARAGFSSDEKQNLRAQTLQVGSQLISSHKTRDQKCYLDLWEKLVERRIVRRRIRKLGDVVAKLGIFIKN